LAFLFSPLLVLFLFSSALSQEIPFISRELHWAVTEEKFELALERFHLGKKVRHNVPVILCHGLVVNNYFMNLSEDSSLAKYLAREGFDVWNLSLRGIGRSLNPLRGGPKSWTVDDIIENDISAVVHYVRRESGRSRVVWVGFELGGLLMYGYLERKGSSGIAGLVSIGAPVTFTDSHQEPMKKLLKLDEHPTLKKIFLYLNTPSIGRLLIPLVPKIEKIFYNPDNMEEEIKARLLGTALAEINPGILDHLLLMIEQGEFISANGDFNYHKNLSKIRIPILLIGGKKDAMSPPAAVRIIYRGVGSKDRTLKIFGNGSKESTAYGHFDLILGKKAREEVFPVIGRWLKKRDRRR
jgi:poly(3-hydroxyalkanoate) synthetase